MKPLAFILVFLIFLSFMGYVFLRGYQCFSQYPALRCAYSIAYVSLFAVMITGWFIADYLPVRLGSALSFVGFTYLMLAIYMGAAFLLIDIFRLFVPLVETHRIGISAACFCLTAVALVVGNYQFNHPKVTTLAVSAENPSQHRQLRIVMASDLHFGSNIRKEKAQGYVQLINAQTPDIVFFVGDIADRSIDPFVKQRIYEDLQGIQSKYGVYGVLGNHEHYSSDIKRNCEYYEKSGITMLIDEAVLIDSSFYVVGRDDKVNTQRKTVAEITANLDKKYPIILLDHQPFGLEEAAQNGVAMQFSGHTHNGQFFPGNLIVKALFELPVGYKKKGGTHYYVSSGLGVWGPLFRIGTQSELVVVDFSY